MTNTTSIWMETPTPLFDELMSKVSDKGSIYKGKPGYIPESKLETVDRYGYAKYIDELLFWEYVEKLKNMYPTCKINIDPRGPYGSRTGNTFQTFESSLGVNYYKDFQRKEKACQLNDIYGSHALKMKDEKDPGLMAFLQKNNRRGIYRFFKPLSPSMDIETWTDLERQLKYQDDKLRQYNAYKIRQKAEANASREESNRIRYSKVPRANLLQLNKSTEPNLLSFEATKEGLNKRAKELEGLFGGKRKNRTYKKQKKSKKTRKIKV